MNITEISPTQEYTVKIEPKTQTPISLGKRVPIDLLLTLPPLLQNTAFKRLKRLIPDETIHKIENLIVQLKGPEDFLPQLPREILLEILKLTVDSPDNLQTILCVNKKWVRAVQDTVFIRKLFEKPVIELGMTAAQAVGFLCRYAREVDDLQLDFSHCNDLNDTHLAKLVQHCKNITKLILPHSRKITPHGLKSLDSCPNLKSLQFLGRGYKDLSPEEGKEVLKSIAAGCPNLTELRLTKPQATNESLHNLSHLDESWEEELDPEGILDMPKLKVLELPSPDMHKILLRTALGKAFFSSKLPWSDLQTLQFFPHLQGSSHSLQQLKASLNNTQFEVESFTAFDINLILNTNPALKNLTLAYAKCLRSDVIQSLSNLSKLEWVDFSHANITVDSLSIILQACPIKSLNLHDTHFEENAFISMIQQASSLRPLALESIILPSEFSESAFLALSQACPQLKSIHFTRVPTNALFKAMIENCASLESLIFSQKRKEPIESELSDTEMMLLAQKHPHLKQLTLICKLAKLTNDGIEVLAKSCPNLETLQLGKSTISDQGVKHLTSYCRNMTHIELVSSELTNQAMINIAQAWPKLKTLTLESKQFSDRGLLALDPLRALEKIDVGFGEIEFDNLNNFFKNKPLLWSLSLASVISVEMRIPKGFLQQVARQRQLEFLAIYTGYYVTYPAEDKEDEDVSQILNLPGIRYSLSKHGMGVF